MSSKSKDAVKNQKSALETFAIASRNNNPINRRD
jgi:hypothetical protein